MLQEDDILPRETEPPFLSALHVKNDTTNLFGYKLGESTENNKALFFFLGKETIQTFNGSMFENCAKIYFKHTRDLICQSNHTF